MASLANFYPVDKKKRVPFVAQFQDDERSGHCSLHGSRDAAGGGIEHRDGGDSGEHGVVLG
jgi:hypothetical protein